MVLVLSTTLQLINTSDGSEAAYIGRESTGADIIVGMYYCYYGVIYDKIQLQLIQLSKWRHPNAIGICFWISYLFFLIIFLSLSLRHYAFGGWKSSGFMLILQSLEIQPLNWSSDCTPSRIRICVKPISRMNSSLECSDSVGILFVTRNMVLMMSWAEYPRVLLNVRKGKSRFDGNL